ncbi:hypothetical protein BV898_16871 [Hypsibius exemplaris]|uniref:Uncharacterized protein n=1 Tax=Hypsibius exemplaris TaxID=2072580 RepID=A0A9X6RLL8_HYPEX|nr:hypothetical protein BV898_16871 [Hypsibius exemplaris]
MALKGLRIFGGTHMTNWLAGFPDINTTKCPRLRGILLNVRPCGHINSAVPIYVSESPSQVFLSIMTTLYNHVLKNGIKSDEWPKLFIVMDYICNIDRTKAAQTPLPLSPPFDKLFISVSKVIHVFHHRNHVCPECKTGKYNPKNISVVYPKLKKRKTEAAEQSNAWLKRFAAVLNSISRNRQLFYLARQTFHRNKYLYTKSGRA